MVSRQNALSECQLSGHLTHRRPSLNGAVQATQGIRTAARAIAARAIAAAGIRWAVAVVLSSGLLGHLVPPELDVARAAAFLHLGFLAQRESTIGYSEDICSETVRMSCCWFVVQLSSCLHDRGRTLCRDPAPPQR